MKKISISDGEKTYNGTLPEGWHEVPVKTFIQYEEEGKDLPIGQGLAFRAHLLTGLPLNILQEDISNAAHIDAVCRWFRDSLPQPVPVDKVKHAGKTFVYHGNLDKLTAGQFEALVEFITQAQGKVLTMVHWLLAVLYVEEGKPQTAESVESNAELFLSLSMDKAYGAVGFFLTFSSGSAARIQKFSELEAHIRVRIKLLEAQLQKSSSRKGGIFRRKFSSLLLSRLRQLTESGNKG